MDKHDQQYAILLKALADSTRVQIFDLLSNGELCACKILENFNITQPTLSYHMKILCDSGLVNSRRDGVWIKYSLNKNKLTTLTDLFTSISQKVETVRNEV